MARKQEASSRAGKKRREAESDSESASDDGVMEDEFEGLVESEEGEGEREGARRVLMDDSGDEDSMEGSRSRSEEDLRDIGSARRLDDDDTGDSAWKGADGAGPSERVELENERVELENERVELEKESGAKEVESEEEGEEEAEAMEEEEEEEEEEEGEAGESEGGEPSGSVSLEDGSDSDTGKGEEDAASSAYSRAFSKILKQSKVATESETGPVLAARQTLVARKLEEEAGDAKDNKAARKEKKELREKAHMYPQTFTDSKEKDLVRLATRGVVKLFNAVSKAQKVQATSDIRDAKVVAKQSKSAFLAEVRGTGSSAAVGSKRSLSSASAPPFKFGTSESQNQSASRWTVVKDDFMLGKQKLKDWDKDEEMGDAAGVQQVIDDDSD